MANSLEISGKFLGASKIDTVGQNNTQIRKFWLDITDNPLYPNTPEFQLRGEKVNLVDNLQKGQTIQAKFNLNGRKYKNSTTGKEGVIVNLDAWHINIVQVQSTATRPAPAAAATPAARPQPAPVASTTHMPAGATPFAYANDEENDLPF